MFVDWLAVWHGAATGKARREWTAGASRDSLQAMRFCFQLAMAVLPLLSAPAVAQEVHPSFCQRLARQLAMQQEVEAGKTVWRLDQLTLGKWLLGKDIITSIGVHPLPPSPADEDRGCDQTSKGVLCHVTGPARLTIRTSKAHAVVEAADGESAQAEIRGMTIICRDQP